MSHKWSGFEHPDPDGGQLRTLQRAVQQFQSGKHKKMNADPMHTRLFGTAKKINRKTAKIMKERLDARAFCAIQCLN